MRPLFFSCSLISRKIGFIRQKRARGLKKVDMLIPLGVVSKDSKPGGQHVHQPVVSRLRHPRLRLRPHRLPGRRGDLHHPPGPRDCRCSACGSREVISRGHVERRFRSLPIGSRTTAVVLPIPRVECQACGLVRQVEVPFADPRRSYTKSFERYALELSRSMTILDVAHHLDVGWDLIKDIQKRDLSRRYAKPKLKHLRAIAIDEIAVAKGHRYLTVVMDLESGAVVFVGDGKGADALKPFWKRLRPSGAKIEAVAMDMSAAYRAAVSDPPAQGEDRLRPLPCRQALQRQALGPAPGVVPRGDRRAAQGGAQGDAVAVAEERREPRRGEGREAAAEGGAEAERAAGDGLLHEGGPAAVLGAAGEAVRDDVPGRLDSPGGGVGDQDPPADGQDAGGAPQSGLLAYYDVMISSGPMEGTNNKIKTMKRQAYGFRDLEFFKLKILAMSWFTVKWNCARLA